MLISFPERFRNRFAVFRHYWIFWSRAALFHNGVAFPNSFFLLSKSVKAFPCRPHMQQTWHPFLLSKNIAKAERKERPCVDSLPRRRRIYVTQSQIGQSRVPHHRPCVDSFAEAQAFICTAGANIGIYLQIELFFTNFAVQNQSIVIIDEYGIL